MAQQEPTGFLLCHRDDVLSVLVDEGVAANGIEIAYNAFGTNIVEFRGAVRVRYESDHEAGKQGKNQQTFNVFSTRYRVFVHWCMLCLLNCAIQFVEISRLTLCRPQS
jgi:hypothetical protein